jgi:hypothetical protein
MRAGTDFQALRRTPGWVEHQHGEHVVHTHPDSAHETYSHRHEYNIVDTGAVGTYSAGMWKELAGRPDDNFGPEHWHLEHVEG